MAFFIFKFVIMSFVLFGVTCLGIIMKWAWESQQFKHDKGVLASDVLIAVSLSMVAVAIPLLLLFTYKVIEMTFTF